MIFFAIQWIWQFGKIFQLFYPEGQVTKQKRMKLLMKPGPF
jgi:hypothetical protein